jgi:hypothetical protein
VGGSAPSSQEKRKGASLVPRSMRLPSRIPLSIRRLLKDYATVRAEEIPAYYELFLDLMNQVEPQGTVEYLWIKDVADHLFTAQKLRRQLKGLLQPVAAETEDNSPAMQSLRRKAIHLHDEVNEIMVSQVIELASFGKDAKEIYSILRESRERLHGMTNNFFRNPPPGRSAPKSDPTEVERAELAAYLKNSPEIERITRLIGLEDKRRDQILREIAQSRQALAQSLRRASDRIIDAEYSEAPANDARG